jgi:hypothetical protein
MTKIGGSNFGQAHNQLHQIFHGMSEHMGEMMCMVVTTP